MNAVTPPDQPLEDVFAEPPEIHQRNIWAGARLAAGATVMFFITFVFAYFYLRSLNSNGRWQPEGVAPPQAYGAVIVALFALSAAGFAAAARRAARARTWLPLAGVSIALALAGCAAQGLEYAHVGFSPRDGGWASVFYGWTSLFVVFALLAVYWLETLFAEGLRSRRDSGAPPPTGLADASLYWALLAGIGVLAWAILYLL